MEVLVESQHRALDRWQKRIPRKFLCRNAFSKHFIQTKSNILLPAVSQTSNRSGCR
jgi:hypothetical protein